MMMREKLINSMCYWSNKAFRKVFIRREPLLNGTIEKMVNDYCGSILCFHKVDSIDPNRLWINQELKVSPSYLEKLITSYLKHNVDVISLDDMASRVAEDNRKPFVCFTFDDGYKDNYVNAFPIFKKYNLPFCINLATSFPEKTAVLFWDILEDILLNNDVVRLNDGTTYLCNNRIQKEQAFVSIRSRIFEMPVLNIGNSIKDLFSNYHFDVYEPVNNQALDWSEIMEMEESRLCTFGNHTHSHFSITDANELDMLNDISLCNSLFKKRIGEDLRYFCFPYGRYNEQRKQLILNNYSFAGLLTLRQDYIKCGAEMNNLPRFLICEKK